MSITTNLFKNVRLSFLKLSTLLLIFVFSASVLPQNLYAATAKTSFSADSAEDENFDKKFREGRDFIDKQEWKKAAEKFNEVITQYPDNKSTDAALYWLAFCYKKQREFEKVGATVDRLLKDHPSSSWTSDARVLLIEVALPATVIYGTAGQNTRVYTKQGEPVTVANTLSMSRALKPAQPLTLTSGVNVFDTYTALNGFYSGDTKMPLDREDEIRLAAFRSLLSADLPKGISAMNELLKPDSKASETLKIEILRSLRRPQNFTVYASTEYFTTLPTANKLVNPSPELLKDSLIKIFQGNSNPKIRREIIYTWVSLLKDEASITKLGEFYKAESDVEVKKAIVNGLGSSNFAFGSFSASNISRTAIPSDLAALSELSSAENKSQTASLNKLLDIVRTEKNPELRRLALSSVQRFGGWNKNGQMTDVLSQIYDSETDEAFKKSIIQSFARINQPQTTKKLLEIARTDKSDALKLEAIRALGQSKDPEALKYLEEIIK